MAETISTPTETSHHATQHPFVGARRRPLRHPPGRCAGCAAIDPCADLARQADHHRRALSGRRLERQFRPATGQTTRRSTAAPPPGAGGTPGRGQVAKAAADGYTLVAVSASFATNAAVQPRLPYDPGKSFTPVALFAKGPLIVAVNPEFPARTPAELIAAIRARPGLYNYASSGAGSVNQFATELLKAQLSGLDIRHIPYRGMAPAVTDLIGNQTQLLIAGGPSLLPMVRAGTPRAVGITSLEPSPMAPELLPLASSAPGYAFELWWGLLAPAGTPADVVGKLNQAVNQTLAKPQIAGNFLKEGAIATPLSPAQFGALIANDVERWKKLARQQGIAAD